MGLACKLLLKGHDNSGYLQHVWFMAEQSALNRFRPECILFYDQGVRDKAAVNGLSTFGYGDANNFYRYLGSAAHKKESKVKTVPAGRYSENKGKGDIKESVVYIIMDTAVMAPLVFENIFVSPVSYLTPAPNAPMLYQILVL